MGNTERKNTEMEITVSKENAAPGIADGCTLRALFKIFLHRQIGQMHFSIRSTQPCSDNCDNHEDAANDIMKLEIRWCERTDIMMMMVIIMMMISSFRSSHHPHTLHCSALDGDNDNDETDDCEYGDDDNEDDDDDDDRHHHHDNGEDREDNDDDDDDNGAECPPPSSPHPHILRQLFH